MRTRKVCESRRKRQSHAEVRQFPLLMALHVPLPFAHLVAHSMPTSQLDRPLPLVAVPCYTWIGVPVTMMRIFKFRVECLIERCLRVLQTMARHRL